MIFVDCDYDEFDVFTYRGHVVRDDSGIEMQRFCTENPYKDFHHALEYATSHYPFWACTSAVDHFYMDMDRQGDNQ